MVKLLAVLSRRPLSLLLAILLAAPGVVNAQAQPPARDVARIQITDMADLSQPKTTLMTFAPGSPTPLQSVEYPSGSLMRYSPDGTLSLESVYDMDGTQSFTYGPVGGTRNQVDLPQDWGLLFTAFSPDNRLLAYGLANWYMDAPTWQIVLIELASGAAVVFEGRMFGDGGPAEVAGGVAPLAWSTDGRTLYVIPYSLDGYNALPFAVDLSGLDFASGAPQALPSQRMLLAGQDFGFPFYPGFSPDGGAMALAYPDLTRPVNGYMGRGDPINTLGLLNLATDSFAIIAAPADNQTLGYVSWTPDGSALLYVTETYVPQPDGVGRGVDPRLFVYRVSDGRTSDPITLTTAPEQNIGMVLACQNTLYYSLVVTTDPTTGQAETTLYSAPLASPTEGAVELMRGTFRADGLGCGGN